MNTIAAPPSPRAEAGEARHPGAPALRALRIGQHLITVVLVIIGIVRGVAEDAPPGAAIGAGLVVAIWYGAGVAVAARGSRQRG